MELVFIDGRSFSGFENYIIYENGEVYSLITNSFLRKVKNADGYLKVGLVGDKILQITIHRAVAKLFIPNPKNLPIVSHKNTDKTDNNVNNLYWSAKSKKVKKSRHKKHMPVYQFSHDKTLLNSFESVADAVGATNISQNLICKALKGVGRGGGFLWARTSDMSEPVAVEVEGSRILSEYPGYRIFRDGKIYSDHSRTYLDPSPTGGYIHVSLINHENVTRNIKVHRLVATAFIPNPHNYPIVNHLDENGLNNAVENLEWNTHRGNSLHAANLGKMGNKKPRSSRYNVKLSTSKKVGKYRNNKCVKKYDSIGLAAKEIGVKPQSISAACREKSRTVKGYYWKYL